MPSALTRFSPPSLTAEDTLADFVGQAKRLNTVGYGFRFIDVMQCMGFKKEHNHDSCIDWTFEDSFALWDSTGIQRCVGKCVYSPASKDRLEKDVCSYEDFAIMKAVGYHMKTLVPSNDLPSRKNAPAAATITPRSSESSSVSVPVVLGCLGGVVFLLLVATDISVTELKQGSQ
ncbi:hypothetical protein Bca4012_018052 [Brassica carinata]